MAAAVRAALRFRSLSLVIGMTVALAGAMFFAMTALAQEAPGKPTNLDASITGSLTVTLTWDAPSTSDVTGYQVLRRRPREGEKQLLVHVADTGSAATTWSESNLQAGVKYVYRVKAINSQGAVGRWSNYDSVIARALPPGKPANLQATQVTHDTIALSWDAPGDSDVTGYQVLRRRRLQGEKLQVHVADTASAATIWSESGLSPEVEYIYRVKAINGSGLVGVQSNRVQETTSAAPEPTPAPSPEPSPAPSPEPSPEPSPGPTSEPTGENTAETVPPPTDPPTSAQQQATPTATPEATSTKTDYDTDDDGLIEIDSLAKLDAIRYDPDGDGASTDDKYGSAFPNAEDGMGCPATGCTGYELTADLDFDTDDDGDIDSDDDYWNDGSGWTPLPRFDATLDGNDQTISNLFISTSGRIDYLGLFDSIGSASTIKNIGLVSVTMIGQGKYAQAGGLAAVNNGTITNSYVTGSEQGISVNNGWYTTFFSYAAGLVASNHGTISDSYATVNVSGFSAGGLVGVNAGTISGSYATGNATGGTKGNAGGLVGWDYKGTITKSYATGNATARFVGGLLGYAKSGTSITKSHAAGNVTSTQWGSYLGGLVGFNNSGCTISDSYSTGDTIAADGHFSSKAGGLTGINYGGTITNSYAAGTVTPLSPANTPVTAGRGLVGNDHTSNTRSTVTASYWDTETTGQANDDDLAESEYGVGKTTSQLQAPTSNTGIYVDWDSETWNFGTASEYPKLKDVGGQD